MGVIMLNSLFLIISVVVMIVATIVGLFLGNIILFESIGIAIAAGCLSNHFFLIHPAFCILIGAAALVGLLLLMRTRIGFWVIGGLMSLSWGLLVAVFVYSGTGKDMIWTYVSWGLGAIIVFALHLVAKGKTA